jgi:hypothetical protein
MIKLQKLMGLGIAVAACGWAVPADGPHCREADRLMRQFAHRVYEEKGLLLTGFGGEMSHEVRTLGVSFCSREPLDVSQARDLYLSLVQDFVNAINQDRDIRPFLAEYPVSAKQVEILLSLQDDQGRMRRDGSICMIINVPEINRVLYHRFAENRVIKANDEQLDEALASLHSR